MALPSSQPVTWLVCGGHAGEQGQAGPGGARQVPEGGREPHPTQSSQPDPRPPASPAADCLLSACCLLPLAAWAHQVPGVAGAPSGLAVPAAPLKGQHHVSAFVRVKHRVPARNVNVEELCRTSWCFHTDQVREHVVTCPESGGIAGPAKRHAPPCLGYGVLQPYLKLRNSHLLLWASPSPDLHVPSLVCLPWPACAYTCSKMLSLSV